jgi:adenylyltransferase/sulfurtransferase
MGGRSAKAVALLKQHGWQNVWNVSGGIAAWSKEIDPEIAVL